MNMIINQYFKLLFLIYIFKVSCLQIVMYMLNIIPNKAVLLKTFFKSYRQEENKLHLGTNKIGFA